MALVTVASLGGGLAAWRRFKLSETLSGLFPNLLLALFITGVAVVMILLLWLLPKWQVARSEALTDDKRFDRENEARKTLAQIIGGVFLLAGLYSSVKTLDLSRRSQIIATEGQITDRFTKAIEQLGALDSAGHTKLEVRLGGIYALERIAKDSERDHGVVMEVLTAYVREHAPLKRANPQKTTAKELSPDADIQAILTVIGRRDPNFDRLPLDLRRVDLSGSDLHYARLRGAQLEGADLSNVNLEWGDLTYANLEGSNLRGADLKHKNLSGTHFEGADLRGADLRWSYFNNCGESPQGCTHLNGAHLDGAQLEHLLLIGADLSGVIGLIDSQLSGTVGDINTKLPPGLHPPDSWKH
jgi:hypothetical protein